MPKPIDPCFEDFLNDLGSVTDSNCLQIPSETSSAIIRPGDPIPIRKVVVRYDAPLRGGVRYLSDLSVRPLGAGRFDHMKDLASDVWRAFHRGPEYAFISPEILIARGDITECCEDQRYRMEVHRGDEQNDYSLVLSMSLGGIITVGGKNGLPLMDSHLSMGFLVKLGEAASAHVYAKKR
jgi:hypothetical protein